MQTYSRAHFVEFLGWFCKLSCVICYYFALWCWENLIWWMFRMFGELFVGIFWVDLIFKVEFVKKLENVLNCKLLSFIYRIWSVLQVLEITYLSNQDSTTTKVGKQDPKASKLNSTFQKVIESFFIFTSTQIHHQHVILLFNHVIDIKKLKDKIYK